MINHDDTMSVFFVPSSFQIPNHLWPFFLSWLFFTSPNSNSHTSWIHGTCKGLNRPEFFCTQNAQSSLDKVRNFPSFNGSDFTLDPHAISTVVRCHQKLIQICNPLQSSVVNLDSTSPFFMSSDALDQWTHQWSCSQWDFQGMTRRVRLVMFTHPETTMTLPLEKIG